MNSPMTAVAHVFFLRLKLTFGGQLGIHPVFGDIGHERDGQRVWHGFAGGGVDGDPVIDRVAIDFVPGITASSVKRPGLPSTTPGPKFASSRKICRRTASSPVGFTSSGLVGERDSMGVAGGAAGRGAGRVLATVCTADSGLAGETLSGGVAWAAGAESGTGRETMSSSPPSGSALSTGREVAGTTEGTWPESGKSAVKKKRNVNRGMVSKGMNMRPALPAWKSRCEPRRGGP